MDLKINEGIALALNTHPEETIGTMANDGTLYKILESNIGHPIKALWESGVLEPLISLDPQEGNKRNQLILYLLNLANSIQNSSTSHLERVHKFTEVTPGKYISHVRINSPDNDYIEMWLQPDFTSLAPLTVVVNGKIVFQDTSPIYQPQS
jgi:predicted DNA-binding antitoxin AbrB/MazE fold protein